MDRHVILSMHFFGLFWFGCLTYGSLVKSLISVFKTKVLNQLTPETAFISSLFPTHARLRGLKAFIPSAILNMLTCWL